MYDRSSNFHQNHVNFPIVMPCSDFLVLFVNGSCFIVAVEFFCSFFLMNAIPLIPIVHQLKAPNDDYAYVPISSPKRSWSYPRMK